MKRLLLTGSVLKLLLLLHSSSSLVKSTKPKANGEVFLTSYASKACNLFYLSLGVSVSITMHKSYSTSNQAFCKRILNNEINIVGPP